MILTSSASDEDSQESDLIGGSYFSHHLASGLLGGADSSGDGRVTLFEAYAYAYDRTVADTAESAAGAQHPTFSYDLAGNGDLVLTDVAARHEGVYFPREAPAGSISSSTGKGSWPPRSSRATASIAAWRSARALPRQAAPRRSPARRRDRGRPAASWSRSRRPPARRAVLRRSRQGGASASTSASRWSLGAGVGFQTVFAAPTARSLFPPTAPRRARLALRDFFRRDWVWGSTSPAAAPTAWPGVGTPFRFSEVSLASSLIVEWPHRS